MLIDIGANLTHSSFQPDLDDVLARARAAGVMRLVVTGADAQGSRDALALARKHPDMLYATAGVHPHHAKDFDGDTETLLAELHAAKEVVAVGETGLDYHRNFSPREAQLFAFERQLGLAIACGKPLFLHQRDAHADFIACLDNVRGKIGRAVVHCFTGEKDELFDYLDRDCYIGVTGWICDERRGTHLRELVKSIPADRLHAGNRCAVSVAARSEADAIASPQRADVSAAHRRRSRAMPRRRRRDHRRERDGGGAHVFRNRLAVFLAAEEFLERRADGDAGRAMMNFFAARMTDEKFGEQAGFRRDRSRRPAHRCRTRRACRSMR